MDGDDSDHCWQHSCSFSPARSLLQPLTIAMARQRKHAAGADDPGAADPGPALRAVRSEGGGDLDCASKSLSSGCLWPELAMQG